MATAAHTDTCAADWRVGENGRAPHSQVLPPEQVLVVLYVACLALRLPVTPMDIVGRALSGALLFTESLGRAGEALDPQNQLGLTALLKRPGDLLAIQK